MQNEKCKVKNYIRFSCCISHFAFFIPLAGCREAAPSPTGTGAREAALAFYQAVARGQPMAVPGSSGFLELAVNGGSAAQNFNLKVGEEVIVRVRGCF